MNEPTERPSYVEPEGTVLPAYSGLFPAAPAVSLFTLTQLNPPVRTIRLEVPTVFGRSPTFYVYGSEEQRFTAADAVALQRLDYILIKGDDNRVSRTHGVLDPQKGTIQDLNSKHGVRVNGQSIARNVNHPGPPHPLSTGDVIHVGSLFFRVERKEVAAKRLLDELSLTRTALVWPAGDAQADQIAGFLRERKRFQVKPIETYQALLKEAVEALSERGLGVLVLALVVEPLGGDRMRVGGEEIALDSLLFTLGNLPGSKVLALQAQGDPAGLEATFGDLAFEDTILLTSTVPPDANLGSDRLEPDIGTIPVNELRDSVVQGSGSFDSVVDGLDALIRPDSNVLEVDWTENYRGALKLIVGTKQRSVCDFEVELSYRMSDPSDGSYRVRHNFDSARGSDLG